MVVMQNSQPLARLAVQACLLGASTLGASVFFGFVKAPVLSFR
jgi:hypothetical protein